MPIELPKDMRKVAVASLERYFQENMDEPIGNIAAGALLDYFVAEVGPLIYNKAITDAKDRMMARVLEVDGELYEEPFSYWRKANGGGKDT